MLLNFDTLPSLTTPNFKGGEKEYTQSFFLDELCRIMKGRLIPGASIGEHCHEASSEIIYVLSGTGSVICNGEAETVLPGQCHYCPKGSTHTLKNNGTEDLVFFAVVPIQ